MHRPAVDAAEGPVFVVNGSGEAVVVGVGSGGVRLHATAEIRVPNARIQTAERIGRALSHALASAQTKKRHRVRARGGKPQRGAVDSYAGSVPLAKSSNHVLRRGFVFHFRKIR